VVFNELGGVVPVEDLNLSWQLVIRLTVPPVVPVPKASPSLLRDVSPEKLFEMAFRSPLGDGCAVLTHFLDQDGHLPVGEIFNLTVSKWNIVV